MHPLPTWVCCCGQDVTRKKRWENKNNHTFTWTLQAIKRHATTGLVKSYIPGETTSIFNTRVATLAQIYGHLAQKLVCKSMWTNRTSTYFPEYSPNLNYILSKNFPSNLPLESDRWMLIQLISSYSYTVLCVLLPYFQWVLKIKWLIPISNSNVMSCSSPCQSYTLTF